MEENTAQGSQPGLGEGPDFMGGSQPRRPLLAICSPLSQFVTPAAERWVKPVDGVCEQVAHSETWCLCLSQRRTQPLASFSLQTCCYPCLWACPASASTSRTCPAAASSMAAPFFPLRSHTALGQKQQLSSAQGIRTILWHSRVEVLSPALSPVPYQGGIR